MKNQFWPSLVLGAIIAAAIVIAPGLSAASYLSHSVTPVDSNLTVDKWQSGFVDSLAWGAGLAAGFTAIWLASAHKGEGLDTKTGWWWMLWVVAGFGAAICAWLIPPAIQKGPGLGMAIAALLALLGYWVASVAMTPDQYSHTPLLGRNFWGHKG